MTLGSRASGPAQQKVSDASVLTKPLTYNEKKQMIASIEKMPAFIHSTIFEVIHKANKDVRYTAKEDSILIVMDHISESALVILRDMISTYDVNRTATDSRRKTTEQYAEQMDHLGSDS